MAKRGKKARSKRGKSARVKGHSFEREWAGYLRLLNIDPTAKRKLEYQEGSSDTETQIPISAQCRCQKSPSVWEAVRDAECAKKKEGTEFAIAPVRRKNVMTIVAMPIIDFLKLLSKVYQDGKEIPKIQESRKEASTDANSQNP